MGGIPSAGLKGIFPPMRMCSAPRHIDAAGRPPPGARNQWTVPWYRGLWGRW